MPRILPFVLAVALAATAVGCRDSSDGPGSGFQTLGEGPAGIEDVVQHLIDPPPYPAPVADEAELVELRSPDVSRRHHLYLAELAESGTLDGELVRGSVVHVADGVTLTVPDGASVATLDGSTVTAVDACAAPCAAAGPSLVAPPEWLQGIRVDPGWELVVPAPTE